MTFRKTLLAATMLAASGLALPLAAQAQPVTGLYVGAGLGANYRDTDTGRAVLGPASGGGFAGATQPYRITTSIGFVGLASVGWGFGNGLRAELEGNYRTNDVDSFRINGANGAQRSGYITTMGVMVNALYDIGATMGWPVHITLGAGVGYAWHRHSNVGGAVGGTQNNISDTDGAFAYQGIVGLSIPIRAVPGLAITAEYRYFATLETTHVGRYTFGGGTGSETIKADNGNHSALIGVRYNFGQAPRVVRAPDRVVDPARSFLVFFDFDRADLTPRAREIIGQAAQASRSQQTTRVEVAGHADRSGTPQYNQGLSQRRANNVAAELVRVGVPRGAISVAAFGESRPLVPTADGVREPQNRRVEIVLR